MPDAVRVGNDCLPDNPSVGFADTSLYTREVLAAAAGRRLLKDARDCHASDIGHWLAMTTVLRPSLEAWAGGTDLVYYVFVVLTGVNFLVEFGVNAVLSVAIARIVQVVGKKG